MALGIQGVRNAGSTIKVGGNTYAILEVLGIGGTSVVYKVALAGCQTNIFALKATETDHQYLKDPKDFKFAWQLLEKEYRHLCNLVNAAFPKAFNFQKDGSDPDNPYSVFLLMEYIDGKDMDRKIQDQVMIKEEDAVRWSIELLGVLEYLHNFPIPKVFQDLTPSNILITPDNRLHLIDFGTLIDLIPGKVFDPLGKPGYADPALYFGGQPSQITDVYAAGAVLYHMVTGQVPPTPTKTQKLIVLTAPHKLNPTISKELERIIMRAMEQFAARRYQSTHEMLQDLQALQRKMTGQPAPPPPTRMFALPTPPTPPVAPPAPKPAPAPVPAPTPITPPTPAAPPAPKSVSLEEALRNKGAHECLDDKVQWHNQMRKDQATKLMKGGRSTAIIDAIANLALEDVLEANGLQKIPIAMISWWGRGMVLGGLPVCRRRFWGQIPDPKSPKKEMGLSSQNLVNHAVFSKIVTVGFVQLHRSTNWQLAIKKDGILFAII